MKEELVVLRKDIFTTHFLIWLPALGVVYYYGILCSEGTVICLPVSAFYLIQSGIQIYLIITT